MLRAWVPRTFEGYNPRFPWFHTLATWRGCVCVCWPLVILTHSLLISSDCTVYIFMLQFIFTAQSSYETHNTTHPSAVPSARECIWFNVWCQPHRCPLHSAHLSIGANDRLSASLLIRRNGQRSAAIGCKLCAVSYDRQARPGQADN